jgi:hypothetical protein
MRNPDSDESRASSIRRHGDAPDEAAQTQEPRYR